MRQTLVCLVALILAVVTSPANAGSIPLVVDQYLPDNRPAAPVTFGVPFPKGALAAKDLETVRVVDDKGAIVAHQQSKIADWDAAGEQGVRWLLIDMLVDPGRSYRLQFGHPAAGARVSLPDIAKIENNAIVIDAGAVKGQLKMTGGFDPFTSLTSLGAPIALPIDTPAASTETPVLQDVNPSDGVVANRAAALRPPAKFNAFYVEHETRGVFRSDLDTESKVVLEENGPIRATIKADGWYTNAAGERFCRYSIRMSFFRNRPDIKIEHTFIYTGLSKDDKIANLGARFQRVDPSAASTMRVYLGGPDLVGGNAIADGGGRTFAIQTCSEPGKFDFYMLSENGTPNKLAQRAAGWIYGIGSSGFTVAIRDAWQQYPWAYRLYDGNVDIQLWTRAAGLLDTTWDGYWSALTQRQKRTLASGMERKEQDLDKWIQRLRDATNATGAAKTHELWIAFIGPAFGSVPAGQAVNSSQMAREVGYPTLAWADPAWMCASQALDFQPHAAIDLSRWPQEESTFRAMLQLMLNAIEANQWYGWWDWGGYYQLMAIGPKLPMVGLWVDNAGQSRWHRARPKSHYHWGRFPWVQFYRGGGREWLRYAQTYTLYSADRAHAHHDGNGRNNGGEYHYDNSVVPWVGGFRFQPSGDQLTSNLQAKDDYVYMYWLTGQRRPLDVLTANGELILKRTSAGDKSFTWKPGFTRGNDIRNAGMQLERIMILYQATLDDRYLKLARQIASAFYPLDTQEKVAAAELNPPEGHFHQALSWAYQGMWFYWCVTKDPAFKPALMAFIERARDYAGCTPGSGTVRALGYGYLLTNDSFYLDLARSSLDLFTSSGITPECFNPGFKQELSPMPGLLGLLANAPESWRTANLPTHEKGQSLAFRYVSPNGSEYLRPARVFFNKTDDKPWSFVLVTTAGGTFQVNGPGGQVIASHTFDESKKVWTRFELPASAPGIYSLVCTSPSERIRKNPGSDTPPTARVLQSMYPVMVELGNPGQRLPVIARSYFFKIPADASNASIQISDLDPNREVRLSEVGGQWSTTTLGVVPRMGYTYILSVPESMRGKVLQLQLTQNPLVVYEDRKSLPSYVVLRGIPPLVGASPTSLFSVPAITVHR